MKQEEVEKLLADFYDGKTTESEEQILKEYFEQEEVPCNLQCEKAFFEDLCAADIQNSIVPVGLEDKIGRLIDEKAEEERRFFHRNRARRNWKWVSSIAATLLLLVVIAYSMKVFREDMRPPTPQDTFSDPNLAYQVLQSTLKEVSANLNKGVAEVKETQKELHSVRCDAKKEQSKNN